jgi:hypothetical protein
LKLNAMPGKILVHNMKKGARQIGGILLRDDDGKNHGIRPRWAQVYSVGDGIDEVSVGDWILIEHGRWTRTMEVDQQNGEKPLQVWAVERESMLLKSQDEPNDEIIGLE